MSFYRIAAIILGKKSWLKGFALSLAIGLIAARALPALASGSEVFVSNCIICHQPDARGVAGIYPPLADSVAAYVKVKKGREYLAHVPAFGLTGPIEVHGQSFDNTMPPLAQLSDEQIAEVINYVLTNFGQPLLPKHFKPLTADEVKSYRAKEMSEADVYQEREKLIAALKKAGYLK